METMRHRCLDKPLRAERFEALLVEIVARLDVGDPRPVSVMPGGDPA